MHCFEVEAAVQFRDWLKEDIRRNMPDHYAALGETGVREAIDLGIARAATHGLVSPDGVTLFVRMMFLFGAEFDADPNLPWAAETLGDSADLPEPARVAALQSASIEYLRELDRNPL